MIQSGIGWPLTMPSDLSACDAGGLGSRREMPPPSEVPANKSEALLASWVVPPNGDVEAPLALFRANGPHSGSEIQLRSPLSYRANELPLTREEIRDRIALLSGEINPIVCFRKLPPNAIACFIVLRSFSDLVYRLLDQIDDGLHDHAGVVGELLGGNDTVSEFLQISHRTFSVSKLNWLSWSCIKIGSRPVQVVVEHVVRASHDFGPVRLSYRYGSGIERRQRFAFDSGHRKRSILSVYQR